MCRVVCVKICEDKHSFAVRMHRPLAFEMVTGHVLPVECSCWYVFGSGGAVMPNTFEFCSVRSTETQCLPF